MSGSTLDIVIVTHDSRAHIGPLLADLQAQYYPFQVIVVDNDSTDGTVKLAQPWIREYETERPTEQVGCGAKHVTLMARPHRHGFGANNNYGARAGNGDWVLFLNPDCRVGQYTVSTVMPLLDNMSPDVGIVGTRIVGEHSTGNFPTFGNLMLDAVARNSAAVANWWGRRAHIHRSGYGRHQCVDWVTGAALWIRRSCLKRAGGWDEEIWAYYDDVDLCYRARQAGWDIWYAPVGEIHHQKHGSFEDASWRAHLARRGLQHFIRSHYTGWQRKALLAAARDVPVPYVGSSQQE